MFFQIPWPTSSDMTNNFLPTLWVYENLSVSLALWMTLSPSAVKVDFVAIETIASKFLENNGEIKYFSGKFYYL